MREHGKPGPHLRPRNSDHLAALLAAFFAGAFFPALFAVDFFAVDFAIRSDSAVTPDFFKAAWNHAGDLPCPVQV